jgi:phosphoribosylaminoimidazole-succinocarboxamide synthase
MKKVIKVLSKEEFEKLTAFDFLNERNETGKGNFQEYLIEKLYEKYKNKLIKTHY